MPREERIEVTCHAHLTDEGVLETLRVVVPMTQTSRYFSDPKTVFVEQSCMRVAEYVPRHVLDVEGSEGGTERMARLAVRAHQGQIKILKDELRALGERNDTLARACLRAVGTSPHIACTPDMQEAAPHVIRHERERLADAQPREEAEQRDTVPRFTELLNDYEKLAHRDVVPAPPVTRDPAPLRWKW
jgi:hypothetical protein